MCCAVSTPIHHHPVILYYIIYIYTTMFSSSYFYHLNSCMRLCGSTIILTPRIIAYWFWKKCIYDIKLHCTCLIIAHLHGDQHLSILILRIYSSNINIREARRVGHVADSALVVSAIYHVLWLYVQTKTNCRHWFTRSYTYTINTVWKMKGSNESNLFKIV